LVSGEQQPLSFPPLSVPPAVVQQPLSFPPLSVPPAVVQQPLSFPPLSVPSAVVQQPLSFPPLSVPTAVVQQPLSFPPLSVPSAVVQQPLSFPPLSVPSAVVQQPLSFPPLMVPSAVSGGHTQPPDWSLPFVVLSFAVPDWQQFPDWLLPDKHEVFPATEVAGDTAANMAPTISARRMSLLMSDRPFLIERAAACAPHLLLTRWKLVIRRRPTTPERRDVAEYLPTRTRWGMSGDRGQVRSRSITPTQESTATSTTVAAHPKRSWDEIREPKASFGSGYLRGGRAEWPPVDLRTIFRR
jgi:hypothetical protein